LLWDGGSGKKRGSHRQNWSRGGVSLQVRGGPGEERGAGTSCGKKKPPTRKIWAGTLKKTFSRKHGT